MLIRKFTAALLWVLTAKLSQTLAAGNFFKNETVAVLPAGRKTDVK
jgi:hypothetical protein